MTASTAAAAFSASWFTVDGGGTTSAAEGLTLTGTIGQPDTGGAKSSEGDLAQMGGFWGGGAPAFGLFDDGFETGDASRWSAEVP